EDKGLSARELAKTAGITGEHIRYIESGQRKTPSFDIVMKILKALHVDLQEFLQETGYLPVNVEPASLKKMRQIPIISWVTAGKWDAVSDNFQPGDADEWTESDVKGKNVFALRIKGDSMEPEFREGDVVIVNPHVEAKPGDYVIVKNDEEEATFKQLKKFGDTLVLHPLNSKYEDIELKKSIKYRIVGKVVKKEKRY
ncbi:MAG: helix-turn-helix domain-containing protein, partial [Nitrospirae bacterium]|nr:helix-turn-helix domain-containing protein [Nitrospirota bacterium]